MARWVLIGLLIFAAGLIVIAVGAMLGYRDGLRDRQETLRVEALEHYRQGVAYAGVGNYELARAEFTEALRLQPDLKQAQEQLAEAESRLAAMPTPTSFAPPTQPAGAPPPTPAPNLTPLPTDSPQAAKAALLNEAQALLERGARAEAIARLQQLTQLDPAYEHTRVEALLFDAYYREGLALVEQDSFEEAVRYFDWALKLRPGDAGATTERDLATRYITALGYWEANWEAAIQAFDALYALRPNYKDVAARLVTAQVEYGDVLADAGSWCAAAEWYGKANQIRPNAEVQAKQQSMAANCASNAPTPVPTPNPYEEPMPATPGTPAPAQPADVSPEALRAMGLQGTLYYSVYDVTRKAYVLYSIHADGTGRTELMLGMHQPQVNHAGTRLIARARSHVKTLGLYLIDLTAGPPATASQVTSHVDDLYASFSPKDNEVVFTSNRMSQRLWTLFIAGVSGQGDLRTVVEGQTPAWAPVGDRIAYQGCGERGNNCGLWTVSSTKANPTLVVSDPSASFPAWSPDGSQIAFMSNRDGNWEIYLVGADSRGLRRLTQNPSSDGMPAWSPDGKAIAYLSDRDGKWAIYVQRLDDGRVARLTTLDTVYDNWMMERIAWGPALKGR